MSFDIKMQPQLHNNLANDFDEFSYANSKIYLNNASVSLMPDSSINSMLDFLIKYNTTGPDSIQTDELVTKMLQNVRKMIAEIISCKPDEIVLTQSTTDGINMVATGLESLHPGCNIIIRGMEHEHHANLYPWLYQRRKKNIQVKSLNIDSTGFFEIDELRNTMDQNTRLVVLSHALYNTGAIIPVAKIGDILSDHNCNFFVDAAQTIGCTDTHTCSVSEIGCDFMSFNGSKWLCGPMGTGIFYCNDDVKDALNPVMIGGESATLSKNNNNDANEELCFNDAPSKFQTGFRNYIGAAGLEASLTFIKKIGLEKIRTKNKNLSELLQDELEHMPSATICMHPDSDMRTSITSFTITEKSPQYVVDYLEKRDIILAVRESGEKNIIRASPHFFNTESQIHELVRTLKQLL